MEADPLNDALTLFASTAPEFGPHGLSNHGPMVVEVLDHLGRLESIGAWVARYRPRLHDAPPPGRPLSEDSWPLALGQGSRYPEWLALFETEMADRPVTAVVGEWVPRLVPGSIGAAAHGLIRTGHALRALGRADNPPRRLEVATGLAYWASRYQELPGPPLLIGRQDVPSALADLPYLPEGTPGEVLISAQVAHVADIAHEFEQAVASLGFGGDAVNLLDALAVGGARTYLRNADAGDAIALIHSVTCPLALELLLPWLPKEDHVAALAYCWQAVAAIHVTYGTDRSAPVGGAEHPPSREQLIEGALASGDEHALKLTEAALRSHARTGEGALLWAALDAATRLRG
ncbi:MAG TPA: hypothetical protein VND70_05800 [Acidimicrobiales bacterium]|nr:hypothetical protein [Acidimicrobiales bacterium]